MELTEEQIDILIDNLPKDIIKKITKKEKTDEDIMDIYVNLPDFVKDKVIEKAEENKQDMIDITTILNHYKKSNDNLIKNLINFTKNPIQIKQYIEVRKSQIHNNGVFAIKNIKKNKIITFYPAHAICDTRRKYDKITYASNKFKINYKYQYPISDDYFIYGNPNDYSNYSLLGHMINDSSYIDSIDISSTEIKNSVARYILSSNNNCRIKYDPDTDIVYILTIKPIKKDEEILMSYLPILWLKPNQINIYKDLLENDKQFKNFQLKNIGYLFN